MTKQKDGDLQTGELTEAPVFEAGAGHLPVPDPAFEQPVFEAGAGRGGAAAGAITSPQRHETLAQTKSDGTARRTSATQIGDTVRFRIGAAHRDTLGPMADELGTVIDVAEIDGVETLVVSFGENGPLEAGVPASEFEAVVP